MHLFDNAPASQAAQGRRVLPIHYPILPPAPWRSYSRSRGRWMIDDRPRIDPDGGVTKFGIAQKQHPGVDAANLTRDGSLAIYQAE